MHVLPPLPRSLDEISLAEDLLGRDDGLVRALKRESIAVAQLAAAVTALAVSVVGVVTAGRGALPVVIAGAVSTLGCGCRAAVRALNRRDLVRPLVISGPADVRLAVVENERLRLLDPHRRETLARCYESIGDEPSASGRFPVAHA